MENHRVHGHVIDIERVGDAVRPVLPLPSLGIL
jgi:hypothetical protein